MVSELEALQDELRRQVAASGRDGCGGGPSDSASSAFPAGGDVEEEVDYPVGGFVNSQPRKKGFGRVNQTCAQGWNRDGWVASAGSKCFLPSQFPRAGCGAHGVLAELTGWLRKFAGL